MSRLTNMPKRSLATALSLLLVLPGLADASPLTSSSDGWTSHSRTRRPRVTMRGAKIGGLSAKLTTPTSFSADALSYSGDQLHVRTSKESMDLDVLPAELATALDIVQTHGVTQVEVSIDRTSQGNSVFQHEAVSGTLVGQALVLADEEFATLIQGNRGLPAGAPAHPVDVQARLLADSDDTYAELARQWPSEPISWPIIRLEPDLRASGDVSLRFEPEVTFMIGGVGVEPSARERKTAEKPYARLIKDIAARPAAYRAQLPAVDHAADLVLALAVLRSACGSPGSCTDLLADALPVRTTEALEAEFQRADALYSRFQADLGRLDIDRRPVRTANRAAWLEQTAASFVPADQPEAWGVAHDIVLSGMKELVRVSASQPSIAGAEARVLGILDKVVPQFTGFAVPDDPELKAAQACMLILLREDEAAKLAIRDAIALSAHSPGQRALALQPLMLGLAFMDESESKDLVALVEPLLAAAQRESYDVADEHAVECLRSRKCSSASLRDWEFDIQRLGIAHKGTLSDRDEPYLQGRFTFLIGDRERRTDEHAAANRLRMLSHDVASAESEAHRTHLGTLHRELALALGR